MADLDRRYEILPQMRDYDRMSYQWTAYVMYTNIRGFKSVWCNTDEHGFRHTWRGGAFMSYQDFLDHDGPKGLIVGGSAVFEVGASADQKTIPSLINGSSDIAWFNFGGRAFNSTQELLLFQFFLPKVDHVVLMSGVNNLVAHLPSAFFTDPFGAFTGENSFYRLADGMGKGEAIRRLLPSRLSGLVPSAIRSMLRPGASPESQSDFDSRYQESMEVTRRDLELWKILSDACVFSLRYYLQPFAPWTAKPLTAEELELFEILNLAGGPDWMALHDLIAERYESYSTGLAEACAKKGIAFEDLNPLMPKDGWMFRDRVHLTDDGAEAVAGIIGSSS